MDSKDIKRISIIFILIIITIAIYFFTNRNTQTKNNNVTINQQYNIILFGPSEITLYEGDEYKEIGYYATLNNKIVTDNVKVTNNINTNKIGEYIVKYEIDNVIKFRNIKVIKNPNSNIEDIRLELIGNEIIELYVGDNYIDPGCLAYDANNNNISSKIMVDNQVNTNKAGTYYVTYSILENGNRKTKKRTVIITPKEEVMENNLKINLSYDTNYTNKDIIVNVEGSGTNFAYIKLPNGNQITTLNTTYTISENGTYYFYVYDSKGNYEVKVLNITNIDKTLPMASCTAKVTANNTKVEVTAYDNSGIANYIYYVQGKELTSHISKFTIPERQDTVKVSVIDKAGNSRNISCEVQKGNLEIHFIAGVSDDDAILIRTNDKVIMIDGGRYEARTKIVNYLKDLGITKIDALIGSHVDWNHVQTHAAILDNFQVGKVYYSVDIFKCVSQNYCGSDDVKYTKNKLSSKGITPTVLKPKDYLEIGDMKLYFIGPVNGLKSDPNKNSLVFILQYGNNKFMFTGDTPSNYMNTNKFLTNASTFGLDLNIDVLKWPHHGYEDLSDDIFKATTPKYAIIPNCCWCSSKYPSSNNKNLMKKYGTTYYQVCDSKNIVLLSDGNNIEIRTNQNAIDYKR